jgi:hypothetical protein
MRSMKLSTKLYLGFGLVVLILAVVSRRLWEPRQRAPVQRPIALNLRVVFFGKEIDYGDIMPAGLSVSVRRGRCLAF